MLVTRCMLYNKINDRALTGSPRTMDGQTNHSVCSQKEGIPSLWFEWHDEQKTPANAYNQNYTRLIICVLHLCSGGMSFAVSPVHVNNFYLYK